MNNYHDLLALAEQENRITGIDINTALKEILHYDILFAISQSPLGKYLVFQGGTALRLCYQGDRYSEDLDFCCGLPDTIGHMTEFKAILRQVMSDRYGLDVMVKAPRVASLPSKGVGLARWTAVVHVPRPDKSDKQKQKIRIEVATVPSYDNEALLITPNYPGLSPGYSSILLRVSTLREIMADKIVAIAGRNYLKARDLWDLKWMMNKSIEVDYAMIKEKLVDYGETESFIPNLEKRLVQMREPKSIKEFEAEMSRFLPTRLRQQMAEIDNFSGRLIASVASQLTGILAVHLGRSIATNHQETLLGPD